ncbi:MAG: roadblock/LC7 domain-containing protein [Candidatus Hodarchaeota archaeon]
MNAIEPTKEQKSKALTQILKAIKDEGKLKGVIFSYREGSIIAENLTEEYPEFNSEEYSSMSASVLDSALRLGKIIGEKKFNKFIAELEHNTIVIIECDEKTFISFVLNENSKFYSLLDRIEDYIKKVIYLY